MRKSGYYSSLGVCIALSLPVFPDVYATYAQQASPLVIEGRTLIDGNGGAPVRDSVTVAEGNKLFDGKVIDRSYHANYSTTFNPPGDQPSPAVEGLPWVVALMKV